MQITIHTLKESAVEIEGSVPWADFEKYQKKALERLGEHLDLPGFRKGHIPENILTKHIPDISILQEMADLFLNDSYPKILAEHKIDAIGQPEIALTKLARGNPLEFKIKTAVLPEIVLPDYKKIAQGVEQAKEVEVTEDEIEKNILQIRKMRAPQKTEAADTAPESDADLPPLDDDFVKSLGNFENVEDFKQKLKENLHLEKQNKERASRRVKIIDKIVDEIKTDMPDILVELELDKMFARLKADIEAAGLKIDEYFKQINKTEEDIRKEWREGAAKRAKIDLLLHKISEVEKIEVPEADLEHELSHLLSVYKDADPARARAYIENVLKNEKVFSLLEKE